MVAFIYAWEYHAIAEIAVTVSTIVIGVYGPVLSALLVSQYSKNRKDKTGSNDRTKSTLKVLIDYFRWSGAACLLLIVISCLFVIPSNMHFLPIFFKVVGALSFGLFAANIFLIWYLLIFLINSLGKAVK